MILGIGGTVVELWLLNCILAYSAYAVLNGGTFSLATVAFVALGGYTAGIMAIHSGGPLVLQIVVAGVIAAVAGFAIARPLERVSGVYLALTSLSLVGLVQVLLTNFNFTGGAVGLVSIPLDIHMWMLIVAVVVIALGARQVERSRVGRAIRMVRLDPVVAGSVGVNVRRVRVWLFVVSAVIGAVGGVLQAHYFGFVLPDNYGFDLVINLLAMVIVGGLGSWQGPLVGAAIFTIVPQWLLSFGDWSNAVLGLILLVVVIVTREGIVGTIRLEWHNRIKPLARRRGIVAEVPGPTDDPESASIATPEAR